MFVKICGTTSEDDALLAVAMGADAVGFVFAPSQRQIAPQIAGDIAKRLPPEILTVGVFRDEAPQRVVEIIQAAGLRGVQLHGRETPDQAAWIHQRVPWLMQAFPAGDSRVPDAAKWGADAILLDSASPGSGKVFDWAFTGELPSSQRLVLAGGLEPANVAEAIERTRPWGVDVATGVERAPGIKDPVRLREFIAAARAASPDNGTDYLDGFYLDGDPGEDSRNGGFGSPGGEGSGPYDWQEG